MIKSLKTLGNYTILQDSNAKHFPFIVAFRYNDGSWVQGHYFKDYVSASEYLMKV